MSIRNSPGDDAELEAFLGRQSPVSAAYNDLDPVEPPAFLDEKVLAAAKSAAKPAPKPLAKAEAAPAARTPAPARPVITVTDPGAGAVTPPRPDERRKRPRSPAPATDDDDDDPSPSRRPSWLMPAALAATVLVAVGVGLAVFMNSPSGTGESPLDGSLFAKRARERSEVDKAATAVAEPEAEVEVMEPLPPPPPPFFGVEGPQIQDLDAAIALVRKELVMVNQMAAIREEARLAPQNPAIAAAPAGQQADAVAPPSPPVPSVVQPRERRLTKILELYDGGNPDLAGDSLEIFLRDFADDPISQRILALQQ